MLAAGICQRRKFCWPPDPRAAAHAVRITYHRKAGGLLGVYLDHGREPILQASLDLNASALGGGLAMAKRAAEAAGSESSFGLVGFTAGSGGGRPAERAREAAFAMGTGAVAASAQAGVLSDGSDGEVAVEILEWQFATSEVVERVAAAEKAARAASRVVEEDAT